MKGLHLKFFYKKYTSLPRSHPSGLHILKSMFLPAKKGEVCCIGGPIGAVRKIVHKIGIQLTIRYVSHLLANQNSLNFFSNPLHKSWESIEEELKESSPEHRKGGKAQNSSFTKSKVVPAVLL